MKLSWWFPAPRGEEMAAPDCLNRAALTRDGGECGGAGGGGGDGEEGVGKSSAGGVERTDSVRGRTFLGEESCATDFCSQNGHTIV